MKKIGSFFIILLLIFFVYEGYLYLDFRKKNAVSDAAFIKSDTLTTLSFKVNGKILKLYKKEGEFIKEGDLLAVLDDRDYKVELKAIEYSIESIDNTIKSKQEKYDRLKDELSINIRIAKNSIKLYQTKEQSLKLSIQADRSNLNKLTADEGRYKKMLDKKLISKSDYELIFTKKEALKDAIEAKKKELEALKIQTQNIIEQYNLSIVKQKTLLELENEIKAYEAKKRSLIKQAEGIKNKIEYCRLFATKDMQIAKKFVNVDMVVKAGFPIYSVVDTKSLYVEVLLSEKKLFGIRKGSKATIIPDAIKSEYSGVVESILPASASTFSLVPRDIASGEFTKLDQRFIVRVRLKDSSNLLVGMGAKIIIKRE